MYSQNSDKSQREACFRAGIRGVQAFFARGSHKLFKGQALYVM